MIKNLFGSLYCGFQNPLLFPWCFFFCIKSCHFNGFLRKRKKLLLQNIADRALQTEQSCHDHADLFAESDEYLFGRFTPPSAVLMDLCIRLAPYTTVQPCSTTCAGFSRPWALCSLEHFSGSWETGLAYHSCLSVALPRVVDAVNELATHNT